MTETARRIVTPMEGPDPEKVKADLLAKYPPKVARKRAKQIVVNRVEPEERVPEINANVRTVPGLSTELHHNAVGKDYTSFMRVGGTVSGTGLAMETPVLGLQLGLLEGLELHLMQLTVGLGIAPPALKLPFVPRLGFPLP